MQCMAIARFFYRAMHFSAKREIGENVSDVPLS